MGLRASKAIKALDGVTRIMAPKPETDTELLAECYLLIKDIRPKDSEIEQRREIKDYFTKSLMKMPSAPALYPPPSSVSSAPSTSVPAVSPISPYIDQILDGFDVVAKANKGFRFSCL